MLLKSRFCSYFAKACATPRGVVQVVHSHSSLQDTLRKKVIACEEDEKRAKDASTRKAFIDSFPEIAHHVEDAELRTILVDVERCTWSRGNSFRDQARGMSASEKRWVRLCVLDILKRTDPLPDEVAAFLEVYLVEKKAI